MKTNVASFMAALAVVVVAVLLTAPGTTAVPMEKQPSKTPFYYQDGGYVEAKYPAKDKDTEMPIKMEKDEVEIPMKASQMAKLPSQFDIMWAPHAQIKPCSPDEKKKNQCEQICSDFTTTTKCPATHAVRPMAASKPCRGKKNCIKVCCASSEEQKFTCASYLSSSSKCPNGLRPNSARNSSECILNAPDDRACKRMCCTGTQARDCSMHQCTVPAISKFPDVSGEDNPGKKVKCDSRSDCDVKCCSGAGNCATHKCAAPRMPKMWENEKQMAATLCADDKECDNLCCRTETCQTWVARGADAKCELVKQETIDPVQPTICNSAGDGKDCVAKCCAPWTCKNFTDASGGCKNQAPPLSPVTGQNATTCDPQTEDDCPSKCCVFNCEAFQGQMGCAAPHVRISPTPKASCDPTTGDCMNKCCRPYTCGAFVKAGKCSAPFEPKNPLKPQVVCEPGKDCAVKCCQEYSCTKWLGKGPPKCAKGTKPVKDTKMACDPASKTDCQDQCCTSSKCSHWFEGGATCPNQWPKADDLTEECNGKKDCTKKCCKADTCEVYHKQPTACPAKENLRPLEDEAAKKITCALKGDCKERCCREYSCEDFVSDDSKSCDSGLEKDSNVPGVKCNPFNGECKTKCCHSNCKVFAKDEGKCGPDLLPMLPAKEDVHCKGDECRRLCCQPKDCGHFWEHGKGCTFPMSDRKQDPAKSFEGAKEVCASPKDCENKCCSYEPFDCKRYLHDHGCENGRVERPGRSAAKCKPFADSARSCDSQCCMRGKGVCTGWGDPHMLSFDKLPYVCRVPGEYVAVQDKTKQQEINVWTYKLPGRAYKRVPPYNLGLALRQEKDTLSWRLKDPMKQFAIEFRFNGKVVQFENNDWKQFGPFSLFRGGKWPSSKAPKSAFKHPNHPSFSVFNTKTGTSVNVEFKFAFKSMRHFNWEVSMPTKGTTKGLCGSYDGQRSNDIMSATGKKCTRATAETCCKTWLVGAEDTMFDPTSPPPSSGDLTAFEAKKTAMTMAFACGTPARLQTAQEGCDKADANMKADCVIEFCSSKAGGGGETKGETMEQVQRAEKATGQIPSAHNAKPDLKAVAKEDEEDKIKQEAKEKEAQVFFF